jgi:hypothetical protein
VTADPLSPEIDRWLRSLDTRDELVMRLAIRGRFDSARSTPSFNRRVDELWDLANPKRDEAYMALVIADARMVGKSIEHLIEPSRR